LCALVVGVGAELDVTRHQSDIGGEGEPVPDAEGWFGGVDCAFARIAGRFALVEPRRRARSFLLGLLSDVDTRSFPSSAGEEMMARALELVAKKALVALTRLR
jgi:hypothetical protein